MDTLVTCTLSQLAPGADSILRITIRPVEQVFEGEQIINRMTITSRSPDPNRPNNDAEAIGIVGQPAPTTTRPVSTTIRPAPTTTRLVVPAPATLPATGGTGAPLALVGVTMVVLGGCLLRFRRWAADGS